MPKFDPECIFCRIVEGKIPTERVFEDQEFLAFPDIRPKAPVHLLIIPKTHDLRSVAEMDEPQAEKFGRLLWVATKLAAQQRIETNGYRLIFNVRSHAGQEVDHLHLHLLGGRPLGPIG